MDIKDMITNPYVLAGGVAVGALILMMNRGGNSTGGSSMMVSGTYPTEAMYSYMSELSRSGTELEEARISASVRATENFRSMLTNYLGGEREYNVAMAETAAGITKTSIQAATALAMDKQDNEVKKYTSKLETNTAIRLQRVSSKSARELAKIDARRDIFIAQFEGRRASDVADAQAQSDIVSGIFNIIPGIVSSFFGNKINA
jgi:hypothetical protein